MAPPEPAREVEVRPARTRNRSSASATAPARTPTVSMVQANGITPSDGTAPIVGLKPTMPVNAAGRMTSPAVCVSTVPGQTRAATAAAEPLLDPPGDRPSPQGL